MPQKLQTLLERPQDRLAEQDAALRAAAERSLIAWKRRQQADEDLSQSYTLEQSQQHFRAQIAHQNWMRQHAPPEGLQTRSSDFPESSARADGLGGADGARGSRRVTQAEALERHLALKFARADGEKGHSTADSSAIVGRLGTAQTLEPAVQTVLERHLESEGLHADLSSLKVHPNSELAEQHGAQALVSGGEIHFAAGQFQPQSLEGQQLLVHEAVHAVQQAQGRVSDGIDQDKGLEGEAERVASSLTRKASSDPKAWFAQAEKLFKSYRADKDSEGREARLLERLDALPDLERSKVLSRVQQKLRPFERELLQGARLEGARKESGAVASTPVLEAPLPSVTPLNTRSTGILYTYGLKRASLSKVRPTASQHAAPSPVPLGEGWQKQLERSPLHDAALSWRGQVSKHLAPTPRQLEITDIPAQVPSRARLFREITGYAPPKAPTGAWGLRDIRRAAQQDPKKLEQMSRGFDSKAMLEKQARLRGALENATREAGVETDPFKRVLNDFGLQVGSAVEAFYARPELHMLAHEMRELRTHEMSSDKRYEAQSAEKSGFTDSLEKELEGLGQRGNRVKVGSGNSKAVQRKASIQSGQKLSADPAAPLVSVSKAHLSEMLSKYPSSTQEAGSALNTARAELPKTTPALQTPTGLSPKGSSGVALEPGAPSNPQIKGGLEAALTPIVEAGIAAQTGVLSAVAEGTIAFGILGFMQTAIAGMVGDQIQVRTAQFEAEKQGAVAAAQTEEEKTRIKNAQIRVQGKDVGAVQGAIDQIDTHSGTKTRPDAVPAPELKGELDPAQMDREAETQEKDVAARSSEEDVKSAVERGENDLFPQARAGTLEGKHSGGAGASIAPVKLEDPGLPGEVWPLADQIHDPVLQPKLDAEAQKAQSAKVDLDAKVGASQSEAEAKIEAADARTEAAQLERQKATQQQVDGAKVEWKKEIGGVKEQYQKDAQKEVGSRNDSIKSKQKEADKKADDEYARGEREAEAKRVEKEKEAQQAKENKKNEAKSFWDKLCSAIQSFFDAVVKLVNTIFDALRTLVKAIFDAVKKAVTFIFDTLKTVITGIISALGEVLKGLVTIALAAFPEIAKKWCEAIDGFVKSANTFIEEQVDSLRDEIIGYLDSAAELIDLGLGIAQGVITAGIESMGYLIRGDLEGAGKAVIRNLLIHLGEFGVRLWGLIETAWEAFKKDPLGFVGMIFSIIGQGFAQFFDHIGEHLKKGLIGWLTGQLPSNITIPKDLSLGSVVTLTLEILGINYQSFRGSLVKALGRDGEKHVAKLETVWDWIKGLMDKGLASLGDRLGEFLHGIESQFIGVAVNFVKNEVIARAAAEIAKMMVPIAGWIAGLQKLIQTIKFVVQILTDVFGAIGEALKGNPQKAIDLVENALSNQLPRAIDWLAGLIGLNGLAAKVRKSIEGMRDWVLGGINKLVKWAVDQPFVQSLLKAVGMDKGKDEKHDEAVAAGLADLEKESSARAENGMISKDQAKAAQTVVLSKHKIFKKIEVFSGGEEGRWDYRWYASQGDKSGKNKLRPPEIARAKTPILDQLEEHIGEKIPKTGRIIHNKISFDFVQRWKNVKSDMNVVQSVEGQAKAVLAGDLNSNKDDGLGGYKKKAHDSLYGNVMEYRFFSEYMGQELTTGKYYVRRVPALLGALNGVTWLPAAVKEAVANLATHREILGESWEWIQSATKQLEGDLGRTVDQLGDAIKDDWWKVWDWGQIWGKVSSIFGNLGNRVGSLLQSGLKMLAKVLLVAFGDKAGSLGKQLVGLLDDVGAILANPGQFVANLINALKTGFGNFATHAPEHLKTIFSGWLTGAAGGLDFEMPTSFNPLSLIQAGAGVFGLSMGHVKTLAGQKLGTNAATALDKLEDLSDNDAALTAFGHFKKGEWSALKGDLDDAVMPAVSEALGTGIRNWVFQKGVTVAMGKVAALAIPGANVVVALQGMFNMVTTLMDRLDDLKGMAKNVMEAISSAAKGVMQGASSAIENGLKNLGKVVLDFAMKTAGLGGLAQKVKQGIVNIKSKVDAFLNKMLERVKPWINKILGKGGSSTPKPGDTKPGDTKPGGATKIIPDQRLTDELEVTGTKHHVWVQLKHEQPEIIMASTPKKLLEQLDDMEQAAAAWLSGNDKNTVDAAQSRARGIVNTGVQDMLKEIQTRKRNPNPSATPQDVLDLPTLTKNLKAIAKPVAQNVETAIQGAVQILDRQQPSVDDLRTTVRVAGGIVEFMKKIAAGQKLGRIDRQALGALWKVPDYKEGLKTMFRNAAKGKHEWIPTNLMLEVIDREMDNLTFGLPPVWIDLQHKMREDTEWIVFNLKYSEKEDFNNKTYTLINGHVGAMYLTIYNPMNGSVIKNKEMITHQQEFHNEARANFRVNSQVNTVIEGVKRMLDAWVWRGEIATHPIHPNLKWNNINISSPNNMASMNSDMKSRTSAYKAHLDTLK